MQITVILGRYSSHNSHFISRLRNALQKNCLFDQMWMLFECFHFLPLLHKKTAIFHRQGVQLS